MRLVIYTRRVCRKPGNKKSCYMKLKTYKSGSEPKAAGAMKVGPVTLGKPIVAVVKTPKLKVSQARSAVFQGSKFQGEEFNLNYAMDGPYAGTWYYVVRHRGETKIFSPAQSKALYNYKFCKKSFSGEARCRWCFLLVDKAEKPTGLPSGKVTSVGKAKFANPAHEKRGKAVYTRMTYSEGSVTKTLWVQQKGNTAAAGKWFQENEKGRLVPYALSYDVYFTKICTKFGKKKECRHCYKIAARPNLALKAIQPAAKLVVKGITMEVADNKLHTIMKDTKNKGQAHMFKACKGGKCTHLFLMVSGPMTGVWFNGNIKRRRFMKTDMIPATMFRFYECNDGLKGSVCRYCFQY